MNRFDRYAAEQGRTPEEQAAHDAERWPGGPMTGFIVWAHERRAEWARQVGRERYAPTTDADEAAFDAWLASGQQVLGLTA